MLLCNKASKSETISCKGQGRAQARKQALRTQGYTHVCVLKLADGSPCNHALKRTKGQLSSCGSPRSSSAGLTP